MAALCPRYSEERVGQGRLLRGVDQKKNGGVLKPKARRWLAIMLLPVAAALAGCGGTSATHVAAQRHGVITGLAVQCSGPPGQPAHQVRVIVYRGHRIVAQQTRLGSFTYRFVLSPGQYTVTTDQSYVVPVNISLRQGQLVRADLFSSCD